MYRWTLFLVLLGCGVEGEEGDEEFRFDDLSDDEKFAYMSSDVLPAMAEVFQAYDSETYANFSCATCHVSGLADGSYAMPDDGLPPLSEHAFPYESDVGLFMEDEVLPMIGLLLGPTDGGRPCTTCHTLTE